MTDGRELRAGRFSDWLDETRRAHADGADIDVPCGACVACCTSSYFIHVDPDEAGSLAAIPAELLFPAPGRPEGTLLLGHDSQGRCPMLLDGRCSIYRQRPRTCRIYDCRVFAAAGLDADRAAITEMARRWEFDYPADDRARHVAVLEAARFMRERAALFPTGSIPDSPADLAALAVRVSDVFLERSGRLEGGGSLSADGETAAAVLEEIEGMRRRPTS